MFDYNETQALLFQNFHVKRDNFFGRIQISFGDGLKYEKASCYKRFSHRQQQLANLIPKIFGLSVNHALSQEVLID